MIYKNDEELQAACELWQKRLRLQDWIVKASICRARDMLKEGVNGECRWVLEKKMANVRILDPVDYPDDLMEPQDHERTLVHELLHLHFAPFDREYDENKDILIEQAIDSIAYGLVNLAREKVQVNLKELRVV